MATLQSQLGGCSNKITKPRAKMVKPILKKLSQPERKSLDLDRVWEEQQNHGYDDVMYGSAGAGRSARDVSFSFSDSSRKLQHVRSPSGTSHVSIATSGSGPRSGTFVHPFAQTPRNSTPPLSYANSFVSLDNTNNRDHSPTITEDEDDIESPSYFHSRYPQYPPPNTTSQPSLRRPSLASQRTSSYSESIAPPALRINTQRPPGLASSRLAHGIPPNSQSELYLNTALQLDSSLPATSPPPLVTSPASSVAPMSPLRSSMDGFRLRSRSDVDTAIMQHNVQAARRKFLERERAKDDKFDRELIRKRERRDNKEAERVERMAAQARKSSERARIPAARKSQSQAPSPAGGSGSRTGGGGGGGGGGEKFMSKGYYTMADQNPPTFGNGVEDVHFESPRRTHSAKKRTGSTWTMFVLWLRTRLFRLGKRD